MKERNKNSNSLGICQRLFNFFMNSLIARGLKLVTLGQPLPQGYDHSLRPAKSDGELMVHHEDHENTQQGSDIQVLFKQSEELESWTPVDPVVSRSEQQKELPLVQEKIKRQVQENSSQVVLQPNFTTVPQSRSGPKNTATVKVSEKEDRSKMKGKSIPTEKLTLVIENEEPERTPRRLRPPLSVALNINEKSDEFIRTRKEAMSRTTGMELKKKIIIGELKQGLS